MGRVQLCPLCAGVHDARRFGLGLSCVAGEDCRNPHHRRAERAALCDRCAGVIFIGDPVVTTPRGTEHPACARKAADRPARVRDR